MATVAIITARGGSKRIPRKNVRPFRGVPILRYPIQAALESECFDEVMVSTDDAEIAAVAREAGAVVPFMRSAQTSDDSARTPDVLVEVLSEYERRGKLFQFACCIYPTAVLLTADLLRESFRLLAANPELDGVVPVARFAHPIQRAVAIVNKRLTMFHPQNVNTRSQDLTPAYHDVGQFYWLRVAAFMKTQQLLTENTTPLVVPNWMVQDIDTEEDWALAEIKFDVLRELRLRNPALARFPR
ncbi:MAG TPA: pseudaminic acid cytidylyltransferase [Gemmataceae bacterium]|nr:pseudaminic acid cytidylyltransferase [Gemmataceae bacterium]